MEWFNSHTRHYVEAHDWRMMTNAADIHHHDGKDENAGDWDISIGSGLNFKFLRPPERHRETWHN
jgi:hypothetical protein